MSRLEKYPKYKDSGVEWLGEIPEGWELTRLGAKFIERKEKVSDKDYAPLSVTKNGIVPQLENAAKTNDGDNRKLVKKGDFVINSRSDRKGSSGISYFDGSVSLINIVLKPNGLYPKFCNYLLKSNSFVEEYYRNGHGIVADLWTTRYWDMKSIILGIPPLQEQQKNTNYLDKKTAQIDNAISLKEQMIERLKERRQIIINDTVTKGLDKNVKMKDSGVEWIGKIPEYWEVEKLFGLCNFIRGNSSFSKDELLNIGKYIALQYGKTYKVSEIDEKYKFYVNDEFYKSSQIVNFGDTIFISTSETIEDLGHSAYYKRKDLGLLGGEQILLKPKVETIESKYLYFSSKVFSKELKKFATGIKVFRFNIDDLKTIYIPIPPKEEQKQIVEYIENQTLKIDNAINLQHKQIDKLKEYKTTLIDSVVIGKVRICDD